MHEKLLQSEIDALLNYKTSDTNDVLTQEEAEALSELCNISMSRVADFLCSKLNKKVAISTPVVSNTGYYPSENTPVSEMFTYEVLIQDPLNDKTFIIFDEKDVFTLTDLLLSGDHLQTKEKTLDEMHINISKEIFKEMMTEAFIAISSVVNNTIQYNDTTLIDISENLESFIEQTKAMKTISVTYDFQIENIVQSKIIQLIPLSMAKKLVKLLLNSIDVGVENNTATNTSNIHTPQRKGENSKKVMAQPVCFPSYDNDEQLSYGANNLDFILDVPLQLVVELGRTKKTINEILALNVGSIVELDNLAEDNVNILVNGKLVARGEVIVIDENFGVRIMEVFTNVRTSILDNRG